MALTATVRYGAKVIGLPSGQVVTLPGSGIFKMPNALPSELDIYNIDTIQRFPLGMKVEIDDNTFRYVEYGGTTKAGDLLQAEVPDAAHDDLDPTGTGTGAGVAVGETIISTADTITLVQDEYAGGHLSIEADAGVGYSYFIESNDDAASNALFRIKMGLAIAITAASDVKLIKSRWKEVLIHPTTQTAVTVGVGVGVGADGSFGFACTKGPWSTLTNGTVIIGRMVAPGKTTAGSVDTYPIILSEATPNTYALGDSPCVGIVRDIGATTEQSIIDLQLDN